MISESDVIEPPTVVQLTEREVETLKHMARGLSNRMIGIVMDVSAHTAKFHVRNVCEKLGDHNRTLAVATGLRLGIIQ